MTTTHLHRLDKRDRDIVRRVVAKENIAVIAADYKITKQRVTQIARAAGVPPRPGPIHHTWRRQGNEGSLLAEARIAADMTQQDLAGAAGVSRTTVQRAERGDMTVDTYNALARVLGLRGSRWMNARSRR